MLYVFKIENTMKIDIPINVLIRSVLVGISMSFIEMKSHKTRSVLSIIGVLIGVATLCANLTLIGGIDHFINDKMSKWVGSIWFPEKMDPTEQDVLTWSRSPGMRLSDANYLRQNSKYVKETPHVHLLVNYLLC